MNFGSESEHEVASRSHHSRTLQHRHYPARLPTSRDRNPLYEMMLCVYQIIPPEHDMLTGFRTVDSALPTSPFLRLPPELRNQIYAYVFKGCEIFCPPCYYQPQVMSVNDRGYLQSCRSLFAPAFACRQMHAEMRLLPYRYSKYTIVDYTGFAQWYEHQRAWLQKGQASL